MKMLLKSVLMLASATLPAVSIAQPTAPLTRAQVESDLTRLEKAGYSIVGSDLDYPASLNSAEARLAAQQDESARNRTLQTGYGGNTSGTSGSGSR